MISSATGVFASAMMASNDEQAERYYRDSFDLFQQLSSKGVMLTPANHLAQLALRRHAQCRAKLNSPPGCLVLLKHCVQLPECPTKIEAWPGGLSPYCVA